MSSFGRRIRMSTAALVAVVLLVQAAPLAQRPQADEEGVKAAFLYNFTKFIDWPSSAFASRLVSVRRLCLRRRELSQEARGDSAAANRCAAVRSRSRPPSVDDPRELPPPLFLEGGDRTSGAESCRRCARPRSCRWAKAGPSWNRAADRVRARERSRAVRGQQARNGRRGPDHQLAAAAGRAPVRRA